MLLLLLSIKLTRAIAVPAPGDWMALCVDYSTAPFLLCSGCDSNNLTQRSIFFCVDDFLCFGIADSPCTVRKCQTVASPPDTYSFWNSYVSTNPSVSGTNFVDTLNTQANGDAIVVQTNSLNATTTNGGDASAGFLGVNGEMGAPPGNTDGLPNATQTRPFPTPWSSYAVYSLNYQFSDGMIAFALQPLAMSCYFNFTVSTTRVSTNGHDCCVTDGSVYGVTTGNSQCDVSALVQPKSRVIGSLFPRWRFTLGWPGDGVSVTSQLSRLRDTVVLPVPGYTLDFTGLNAVSYSMAFQSYRIRFLNAYVASNEALQVAGLITQQSAINAQRLRSGLDCLDQSMGAGGAIVSTSVLDDYSYFTKHIVSDLGNLVNGVGNEGSLTSLITARVNALANRTDDLTARVANRSVAEIAGLSDTNVTGAYDINATRAYLDVTEQQLANLFDNVTGSRSLFDTVYVPNYSRLSEFINAMFFFNPQRYLNCVQGYIDYAGWIFLIVCMVLAIVVVLAVIETRVGLILRARRKRNRVDGDMRGAIKRFLLAQKVLLLKLSFYLTIGFAVVAGYWTSQLYNFVYFIPSSVIKGWLGDQCDAALGI